MKKRQSKSRYEENIAIGEHLTSKLDGELTANFSFNHYTSAPFYQYINEQTVI